MSSGVKAGVGQRVADAADDRLAVRARARAVEGVGHLAAAVRSRRGFWRRAPWRIRRLSSTSAPAPSAMTKPSRFLAKGLARLRRRIVRGRQRRQQRKADQRFRIDRAVGADAERRLGFAAADRLDAELDRGRARRAGGRQRNRRALGAELVGQMIGDRAEHEALVDTA